MKKDMKFDIKELVKKPIFWLVVLLVVGILIYGIYSLNKNSNPDTVDRPELLEKMECGKIWVDEELGNSVVKRYVLEFDAEALRRIDLFTSFEEVDDKVATKDFEADLASCNTKEAKFTDVYGVHIQCNYTPKADGVKERVGFVETLDFAIADPTEELAANFDLDFKVTDDFYKIHEVLSDLEYACG